MSPEEYDDGQTVKGNGRNKVDSRIEAIFLDIKPPTARRDAVFCMDDLDFSRCGVDQSGYIYECVCDLPVQRLDYRWIGPLQLALLKIEYRGTPVEGDTVGYPDWSDKLAHDLGQRYWAG
jgi:hypothetical protein